MSTGLVAFAVGLVVAVASCVCSFYWGRSYGGASSEDAVLSPATLLASARGDLTRPRYEVEVVDLGTDVEPTMRWRWVVWDADRELRIATWPHSDDPAGEDGIERPYMLGNTSTEAFATLNAFRWCRAQGARTAVAGGDR